MSESIMRYLFECLEGKAPSINKEVFNRSGAAWLLIKHETGTLMPIPAACTGPDGEMFFSWDRRRHHLELEIISGEPAYFFYRDRETGQTWSEDHDFEQPFSERLKDAFKLFYEDQP